MPSSSMASSRCTAATAAPMSPSDSSAPEGRWIAVRETGAVAVTAAERELAAAAASGCTAGVTAMVALTASVAPLRRFACLRLRAASSRRWTDRDKERAHTSGSPRSRQGDGDNGNDSI
jgi:hypothetical protein